MTHDPRVEHGSEPGTYTYRGWAIVQCPPGPVDVDAAHMVCPIGRSMSERVVLPSLAVAAAYILQVQGGADLPARSAQPTDRPRPGDEAGGVRNAS